MIPRLPPAATGCAHPEGSRNSALPQDEAESTSAEAPPNRYFCYLLTSETCKATYIGASVDPWHRLRQHNGELCGGAKYTRRARPWDLRIVVSGFRDWSEALRFEWAWKHGPCRRRVVRGVNARVRRSGELVVARAHLSLRDFGHTNSVHDGEKNGEQRKATSADHSD
jgi:predicted GIY-YIG superfamily endonuclease